MGELYLSKEEATLIRYGSYIWGCLQWWDIVDRFIIKRYYRARATGTNVSNGASAN